MTPYDPSLHLKRRADEYAADARRNAPDGAWCATEGCKHRTQSLARLCPVCEDREARGR